MMSYGFTVILTKQPVMYCRYVDDIFLAFQSKDDVDRFFQWMNDQYPQIKFTLEEETNNQISFLDVLVHRHPNGEISTSVYRKPTFSGLYLKWDSFVPKRFKRGLVSCLLYCAWRLCSSYELLHHEIDFIETTLLSNGYPLSFLSSCINNFLKKNLSNSPVPLPTYGSEKRKSFLTLPYCGKNSLKSKDNSLGCIVLMLI